MTARFRDKSSSFDEDVVTSFQTSLDNDAFSIAAKDHLSHRPQQSVVYIYQLLKQQQQLSAGGYDIVVDSSLSTRPLLRVVLITMYVKMSRKAARIELLQLQ